MTDETPPVKPQSEVLFLLGGLNAKMDAVLSTQAGYEARLGAVEVKVAELKIQQPARAPWWSVVGGVSSLLAVISTATALIILFTK